MIHGDIGAAEKLGAGAQGRRSAGDPEAGADIDFAIVQVNRRFQHFQHRPGERRRLAYRLLAADGHGKLVPAHARQHSPGGHPLLQLAGDVGNQRIADVVPVVIVNVFKAVEVDKHHALQLVLRSFTHHVEALNQRPPVGQPAQPVGHGDGARQLFPARQLIQPQAAKEDEQQDQAGGHQRDQANAAGCRLSRFRSRQPRLPAEVANNLPGVGAQRHAIVAAGFGGVQMTNLKSIPELLQHIGVDVSGNHQIAPRIVVHLQAAHGRAYQANSDKGNPLPGSGYPGVGAGSVTQRRAVLGDHRLQPAAKKADIRLIKGLTAKRSPQHPVVLIEDKGTVVEIIYFEARTPGIKQPFGIERWGIGLLNGVVPDGVIQHQRHYAVHRGLHRAVNRKHRAVAVDLVRLDANQVLRQIKQGNNGSDQACSGEENNDRKRFGRRKMTPTRQVNHYLSSSRLGKNAPNILFFKE